MSRVLYLVGYDICDPRRLRQVSRFVRGYRVAGQKSASECLLMPGELKELAVGLVERMSADDDRAHIFQLDPRQEVVCFGLATTWMPGPFVIV